jgi:hypothetical protein
MSAHSTDIDHGLKSLASESIKQGGNVRAAVRDLTLNALQQRELTLDQIRKVLRSVAVGVNLGVADREAKVEQALADTVAGMDDAMLKAVQASNVALHKLTGKGYDFEDSHLKQALAELEGVEDAMFRSLATAMESAGEKIKAPWERVLKATRLSGTAAGTQVASTLRDYATRAQAAMREQRQTSFKAAHLLTQNFATLASGILIGMSEGLGATKPATRRKARPAKRRKVTKSARKITGKSSASTAASKVKLKRRKTSKRGGARARSAK